MTRAPSKGRPPARAMISRRLHPWKPGPMRTSRSVTCLLPPLLAATASGAQNPKEAAASPRAHMAALELKDADAGPGVGLEFRRERTGDIAPRGESCEGRLPCGALVRAERLDQDE